MDDKEAPVIDETANGDPTSTTADDADSPDDVADSGEADGRDPVDDGCTSVDDDDQLKTLGDTVRQQKNELDYYQRQLVINEHKYWTDIGNLKSQLQTSNEMYDTAKQEKEAAFMRYVFKEKEILDLNTEKKKLMDSLKERDNQISRLKTNSKEVASCMNVIETKNKEIQEYKAAFDLLKDEKAKTLKEFEHWKTNYEVQSKSSQETTSKLLYKIQELQNKLECLTEENESFNKESNLERIVLNSKLYLDSKKCSEQLSEEIDKFKSIIQEENHKLTGCMCTITSLQNENMDLKTHTESCEIKTNELLVFTESLSARNASLQSECKNFKPALDKLKLDCDLLKQKNIELKIAFKVQNDKITKEKEFYDSDKKILDSHLAQKIQTITDLKITLERTQDDLHVSKRRYKTTVTELTRELKKKNVEISDEMKMVIDKMVKVQQENARICEKLDFIKYNIKHLVCELKKRKSGCKNG